MMEQWDEDNRDKIDWTGAAMVVQGASHLIARKVDVLHTETRQAADDLKNAEFDDVDQEGNNNDGSGRKRKKSRLERLMEAKDIDEFNEGETFIDEDEEKRLFDEKVKKDKESGRGQKLIPPTPLFFQDLEGKDRGRPLYEVNTGEFIGYANDFWCHRADLTNNGLVFPGQKPEDPDVLALREPNDHVAHSNNPEPMNEENLPEPDYDDMPDLEKDFDDEPILTQPEPTTVGSANEAQREKINVEPMDVEPIADEATDNLTQQFRSRL